MTTPRRARPPRLARTGLVLSLALGACTLSPSTPVATVSGFEPERYVGQWRQIATIPAWFQRRCVANTRAEYALIEGDQLSVLNTCETKTGKTISATGRARFTGPPEDGRLEVTFLRLFGSWMWFAAGDYLVMRLGPEYEWSVVGHPSRNYAWVLAREDELADDVLASVATVLEQQAFDACRLVMTTPRHDGRLCDVQPTDPVEAGGDTPASPVER